MYWLFIDKSTFFTPLVINSTYISHNNIYIYIYSYIFVLICILTSYSVKQDYDQTLRRDMVTSKETRMFNFFSQFSLQENRHNDNDTNFH